jgi:hypothetical protein
LKAVPRLRALLWEDRKHFKNRYGTSYAVESQFCKGKVNQAQLRRNDRKSYGIGMMDWVSSRIGLITGRFLDLR